MSKLRLLAGSAIRLTVKLKYNEIKTVNNAQTSGNLQQRQLNITILF